MTVAKEEKPVVTAPPGHLAESHAIFDRVTRLEATVTTLVNSMQALTDTVSTTAAAVSDIRTSLSSVGKTDGKTIVTLGSAMLGSVAMIGALFLGPINRDLAHQQDIIHELRDAAKSDVADKLRVERLDGKLELLEWRIGKLDGGQR